MKIHFLKFLNELMQLELNKRPINNNSVKSKKYLRTRQKLFVLFPSISCTSKTNFPEILKFDGSTSSLLDVDISVASLCFFKIRAILNCILLIRGLVKKHSIRRVLFASPYLSSLGKQNSVRVQSWLAMRRRLCTSPSVSLMKSSSTKTTNQWNSRQKKENARNVEKLKITGTRLEKVEEKVVRTRGQVSRRFIRQKNRTLFL